MPEDTPSNKPSSTKDIPLGPTPTNEDFEALLNRPRGQLSAPRSSFEGSKTIAGAVAFSRTGDYELGEYDDAVILTHVGEVPEEMLALPY